MGITAIKPVREIRSVESTNNGAVVEHLLTWMDESWEKYIVEQGLCVGYEDSRGNWEKRKYNANGDVIRFEWSTERGSEWEYYGDQTLILNDCFKGVAL